MFITSKSYYLGIVYLSTLIASYKAQSILYLSYQGKPKLKEEGSSSQLIRFSEYAQLQKASPGACGGN